MKVNWVIENMLAHSMYPSKEQFNDFYKIGIRAIVSLVKRSDNEKILMNKLGIKYFEVGVKDFTAPTIEQLEKINTFIDSMINKKKPVLVHCIAGGRSGTVLISYLIKHGGSFNDSILKVRELIKDIDVVECQAQEEILKKFELHVRKKINNKKIQND